mmetsp:Transcript_10269/g.29022  ORF Transcript_10269/g.29022 Transcript_10269/m.29022 type:complete len:200 (-) Transcript_10269:613-1212(-)
MAIARRTVWSFASASFVRLRMAACRTFPLESRQRSSRQETACLLPGVAKKGKACAAKPLTHERPCSNCCATAASACSSSSTATREMACKALHRKSGEGSAKHESNAHTATELPPLPIATMASIAERLTSWQTSCKLWPSLAMTSASPLLANLHKAPITALRTSLLRSWMCANNAARTHSSPISATCFKTATAASLTGYA